ncbi:MAG: tRNA (adenosine(37)-N6)-dimethylallyltransferase MiaA [Spirochaetaceae bacterium]|jgi:tRNA dimethylallyltransferase|nr:tRNA (adenosine(37)-N6)-dimethylallyltransferase MiaA [Spirochaetaceae bacterium]
MTGNPAGIQPQACPSWGKCPVFILFGPTAAGKTAVLERLFTGEGALDAEIISADSMQVYRGMRIGTAKPPPHLCERLPHHLIDIRNPDEQFNVGDFVRLAEDAVRDIAGRGKLPVISGGTGFYISNFVNGLPDAPPSDTAIRVALKAELKERGGGGLMEELRACDAASAARIHQNDEYRLLRALEVFRLTGKPLSSYKMHRDGEKKSAGKFFIAGLERRRDELYRRIDTRCREMIQAGLYDEVKSLFESGYTPRYQALKAIGYKEFFYEDGNGEYQMLDQSLLPDIEKLIAKNSRQYAKRQSTYFKNMSGTEWFSLDGEGASFEVVTKKIRERLHGI